MGVMSGNFVQRGDFALLRKHARARAAVESGVDLVLELPLPWAVASAERFARGGVEILSATGVVTHLAFGSECGDAAALERLAEALHCEAFPALLRRELERGQFPGSPPAGTGAAYISEGRGAALGPQ
ncbi:MAG: nucleotidyltransferase family protein [Dysosmobacter sp.]